MYKKYFQVEGRAEEIKITTDYDLGGYNYFSGGSSRRGYYLYAQPVTRGNGFESCVLFDGHKTLLKEVSRQSSKAEKEAERLAETMAEQHAKIIAEQKGWTLA